VELYVVAGENVDLGGGVAIEKGERILMEISRKFLSEQLRGLAYQSGFYFQVWLCDGGPCSNGPKWEGLLGVC